MKKKTRSNPTYIHQCPECKFLGTDDPKLEEEQGASFVDMYIHSEGDKHLFWRRWGDDLDEALGLYFSPQGSSLEGVDPAWMAMVKRVCH